MSFAILLLLAQLEFISIDEQAAVPIFTLSQGVYTFSDEHCELIGVKPVRIRCSEKKQAASEKPICTGDNVGKVWADSDGQWICLGTDWPRLLPAGNQKDF